MAGLRIGGCRWCVVVGAFAALALAGCGEDSEEQSSTGTAKERGGNAQERAEKARARARTQFREVDGDRNGSVDDREFRAEVRRDFRDMDLNGNGLVTQRDIDIDVRGGARFRGRKLPTPKLRQSLPYDANNDGRITLAEYERHVRRNIAARIDRNNDGRWSEAELVRYQLSPPPRKR